MSAYVRRSGWLTTARRASFSEVGDDAGSRRCSLDGATRHRPILPPRRAMPGLWITVEPVDKNFLADSPASRLGSE